MGGAGRIPALTSLSDGFKIVAATGRRQTLV
jgi:hypothetical protein